jgi:DNA primase large subunit
MTRLLSRQVKGENLSHVERRTLATYLIVTGRSVDELMDMFKTSPDFNERVARYQLEHLAGLRGARKKYLPASCKTMKTYGLCFPDQWCDNIRNPLQYRIG